MDAINSKIKELQAKHNIPQVVVDDVLFRIGDWLQSGGSVTDHYIEQQFDYIHRFISYKIKVVKEN